METATPHLIPLANGAVLFKGWLDDATQAALATYTFSLVCPCTTAPELHWGVDTLYIRTALTRYQQRASAVTPDGG